MSKTKYYYIWIEGLTPRSGEKIETLVDGPNGHIQVEYTTLLTKALRVKKDDREAVRDILTRYGITSSFITFVPTSYAPGGTVFKSGKKVPPFDPKNISDEELERFTLRSRLSSRGGGVEISVSGLGYQVKGVKMSAYQNYLGGGLLGKICSSCNLKNWQHRPELIVLSEMLKKYFHRLTNPNTEWEGKTYDQNQNMPVSAY